MAENHEPHITKFCKRLYECTYECANSQADSQSADIDIKDWPDEAQAFVLTVCNISQATGVSRRDCHLFIKRCGEYRDWVANEEQGLEDISDIARVLIDWHVQDRPSYQRLIRWLVRKYPQIASRMKLPGAKKLRIAGRTKTEKGKKLDEWLKNEAAAGTMKDTSGHGFWVELYKRVRFDIRPPSKEALIRAWERHPSNPRKAKT